jgi:hypothetical protein
MLGMNLSPGAAGLLGGMSGGVAQAYATMGEFCLLSIVLFTTPVPPCFK